MKVDRDRRSCCRTRKCRTPKTVVRTFRHFTKPLLQVAARNAEKWDFNRQLDLDAINALPPARFPITLTMIHRHRHGKPAEAHMRAMVVMDNKGGIAIVDMPLEFYDRLPSKKVRIPKSMAKLAVHIDECGR